MSFTDTLCSQLAPEQGNPWFEKCTGRDIHTMQIILIDHYFVAAEMVLLFLAAPRLTSEMTSLLIKRRLSKAQNVRFFRCVFLCVGPPGCPQAVPKPSQTSPATSRPQWARGPGLPRDLALVTSGRGTDCDGLLQQGNAKSRIFRNPKHWYSLIHPRGERERSFFC